MFVQKSNRLLLFFILLLISCTPKRNATKTNDTNIIVKTILVENKKISDDLNSFGTITYKTKNDITNQVEGTIIQLYVKEGDTTNKGQHLALLRNVQLEIQKEQYKNTLESAKAALLLAQTKMREERLSVESRLLTQEKNTMKLQQKELELKEAKNMLESKGELHQIGGITDSAYQNLQLSIKSQETDMAILKKEIEISQLGLRDEDLVNAGYSIPKSTEEKNKLLIELNTQSVVAEIESAQASLRNAEKSIDSINKLLDELVIRSTVNGVIGALYFENGEYVAANEKIATIMDISRIYAVFSIQEQDIINFSIGTPLNIEIPSLQFESIAKIDEISPVADPQSGNFSVKAEIDNINNTIKPGMFIKCTIPRKENLFYPAIPETAIVQKNDKEAFVFCVVKDIAVLKKVQIHTQKDGWIWLDAGLTENEIIIDKPSPFLKEGEYVQTQ